MTATPTPPKETLALLAHKIAPRQFDVSYRFQSISLRDQIVRSQTLVRSLVELQLAKPDSTETGNYFQLLIVGAGAAGLAAAKEADDLGISFVLIEKGDVVPGGVLKSSAQRYVSPAMYEWPHPNHKEHSFPLNAPTLLGEPGSPSLPISMAEPLSIFEFGATIQELLAHDLARWEANLIAFIDEEHLQSGTRGILSRSTTLPDESKNALTNIASGGHGVTGNGGGVPANPTEASQLPPIWLRRNGTDNPGAFRFQFQYVIYAGGFPPETQVFSPESKPNDWYAHVPFWKPDQVGKLHLGFNEAPRVGILGTGDGALQDALRCLMRPDRKHPLDLWNSLMDHKVGNWRPLSASLHVQQALAKVAAADSYTTGGSIWTKDKCIFKSLDAAFNAIIEDLLKVEGAKLAAAVNAAIRPDVKTVTVVTREGYFTKAYALNRFLLLLLAQVLARKGSAHAGKLEILAGTVTAFEQQGDNDRGGLLNIQSGSAKVLRSCELVILRGGLETTPQLIGLSGDDPGRTELGRIPPAIRSIVSA